MVGRVLHVVDSLAPEAGSVAVCLRALFSALANEGIACDVVSTDANSADINGVRAVRFDDPSARRLMHEADLVHLHGWGSDIARKMASAAAKARKPFLIAPHGALTSGPYNKKSLLHRLRSLVSERSVLRRAAALAGLNQIEEDDLVRRHLNDNVVRLTYGLSFGDYAANGETDVSLPQQPDGRCLLFLGPIHPVEGLVPLLKAFAQLGADSDGWNIVLAGRAVGDWRKMLQAAVQRKGAADRVLFAPAPDVAMQRAWLVRASVLVAPSLHIRCPVSVMQAVAASTPVVASHQVTPSSLEECIHVCSPSHEQLAESLRAALGCSDDERALRARRAREKAVESFDWPVLVKRFVEVYRRVA